MSQQKGVAGRNQRYERRGGVTLSGNQCKILLIFPADLHVAHPPEGRAPVASDISRAAATRIVHAHMRSHATVSSSNPGVLAHAASP